MNPIIRRGLFVGLCCALGLMMDLAGPFPALAAKRLQGGRTDQKIAKAVLGHLKKARKLVEQGKTTDAIAEYKKVLGISPEHLDAYLELGLLYQRTGIHDLAVSMLEPWINLAREREVDPTALAAAEVALAKSLIEQGDQEKAAGFLTQATRHAPDDPEAWRLLARIQIARKQPRGAMTSLTEVLKRSPDDLPVIRALGKLALNEKDTPTILLVHDLLRRLEPKTVPAFRHHMHRLGIKPGPEPLPAPVADPYAGAGGATSVSTDPYVDAKATTPTTRPASPPKDESSDGAAPEPSSEESDDAPTAPDPDIPPRPTPFPKESAADSADDTQPEPDSDPGQTPAFPVDPEPDGQPPAEEEIQKQVARLFDEQEETRQEAQAAFKAWGDKGVPLLEQGLTDPDPERRIVFLQTLSRLGAKARQAYPAIQEAANDPDPGVQAAAQAALESLMNED